MTSTVVFASRGSRRCRGERARKPHAATVTLVTSLLIGIGTNASANSNQSVLFPSLICAPEVTSPSPLGITKCPASQRFTNSFNFLYNSPVLGLRASSFPLDDVTSELPKLQFDLPPSKPVQLAALTPPAAVDALVEEEYPLAAKEITGELPKLQFDLPPPKPVQLAALTPATAPADTFTEEEYPLAPPVFTGVASTYNPHDPRDKFAGGMETASGQMYEINGWTAAIRTDLRKQFGGVRYGRNYKLTFALVELGGKRVIVKINDVGPLRPGRIIDLNRRAMRYFDPSLELGLLQGVQVTPLDGTDWTPGPVHDDGEKINVAGTFGP